MFNYLFIYQLQYFQRIATYFYSTDNFEIILSTFNDNRNGLFVINPNGARADVLITDEGDGFNVDWNGVWYTATTKTDEGWFAEIHIP